MADQPKNVELPKLEVDGAETERSSSRQRHPRLVHGQRFIRETDAVFIQKSVALIFSDQMESAHLFTGHVIHLIIINIIISGSQRMVLLS